MWLERDHNWCASKLGQHSSALIIMTSNPNTTQKSGDHLDLVNSTQADLVRMERELDEVSEFVTSNPSLLGGEDVADLLQRLTNAESMAEGMENKIDNVLQNLDKLLGILDNTAAADKPNNVPAQGNDVGATSAGDHSNAKVANDASLSS